jgi:hypothetical protein
MDIAGHDSVIFTWAPADSVVRRFVDRVLGSWPHLLMDVECSDEKEHLQNFRSSAECLKAIDSKRHAIIYFYRGEKMKRFFEDHSFSVDAEGQEGPFSVHFRRRTNVLFELAGVNELASGEKGVGSLPPYPAALCCPTLLEITLVSPSDPSSHAFSRNVMLWLRESCLTPDAAQVTPQ